MCNSYSLDSNNILTYNLFAYLCLIRVMQSATVTPYFVAESVLISVFFISLWMLLHRRNYCSHKFQDKLGIICMEFHFFFKLLYKQYHHLNNYFSGEYLLDLVPCELEVCRFDTPLKPLQRYRSINLHWNENVVILKQYSLLAALAVVIFHWLQMKWSLWQIPVPPVMKSSSKWRHFRFNVRR